MATNLDPTVNRAAPTRDQQAIIPQNNNLINEIDKIPDDVLNVIFSFFNSLNDIRSLLLTNWRFNKFVPNIGFWEQNLPFFKSSFKVDPNPKSQMGEYARITKKKKNIEINIGISKFRERVIPLPLLPTNMGVWSNENKHNCVSDNSIRIFDMESGKCLGFLNDIDAARGFIEENGIVYVVSSSSHITIYDLESRKPLNTLTGHTNFINYIILDRGKLYSSSDDGTVKIWNPKSENPLLHSFDFGKSVNRICIRNNELYAGLSDGSIVELNIETFKEIRTFKPHSNEIIHLEVQNNHLLSGSMKDGSVHDFILLDLNDDKPKPIHLNYAPFLLSFLIVKDKLIYHTGTQAIAIQDLRTRKCTMIHAKNLWEPTCLTGMYDGVLFTTIPYTTSLEAYDFNYPCLSPFDAETLKENISILKEMVFAERDNRNKDIKPLAEKLHPHFQECLKQYAFKIHGSFTIDKQVMECVQKEVYLELLLYYLYHNKPYKISQIITQLQSINFGNQNGNQVEQNMYSTLNSRASFEAKEAAITAFQSFLRNEWGPDLSFLLADLGIVSKEEYSEKLQCNPKALKDRGIASLADLHALNVLKAPVLTELPEEALSKDLSIHQRRDKLVNLLKELSEQIEQRLDESEHSGVAFFGDRNGYGLGKEINPWPALKKEFIAMKEAIGDLHDTPSKLGKTYDKFVKDVNSLTKRFNNLNREYQILRLHTYIHQTNITMTWTSIKNDQVIDSLADYIERNPDANPFRM